MLLEKFVPIFNSLVDIKNHTEKFFAEKSGRFWKDEIFKLRDRWGKVVEQNDTYIYNSIDAYRIEM